MTEKYFVECLCGKSIGVELYDAGTTKTCPSCRAIVDVPGLTKLKEMTGDKYPLLRPIEKIRKTLELGEPPFDGVCHVCGNAEAEFEIPITFDVVVKRHIRDGGGIYPTLSGVTLVAAPAEEFRESTTFPLLLCPQCDAQFESAHWRARIKNMAKTLFLLSILGLFIYYVYQDPEAVMALAGIFSVIGAIAWAVAFRQTKKGDLFINQWINHVRWVPEVMATEDEYKLSVGKAQLRKRHAEPS